jgi:hypothetical protein
VLRPLLLTAFLACTATVACGPGLEAMHENTLRFEHCYRLDMDVKIAPPHREHCWRDWTETYAVGQPLDRVEYARRRITQLESGEGRTLAIQGAHPGARVFEELAPSASAAAPMAAPAPTSAHAPPPTIAPAPEAAAGARAAPSSDAPRPGDACAMGCGTTLGGCTRLCETKQADCATCREDYRRCMRRCFE